MILKEHTPGFMPGGGARVQNLDTFVILYAYALKFSNAYILTVTFHKSFIFKTWVPWRVF